jgi:hypothetical protein
MRHKMLAIVLLIGISLFVFAAGYVGANNTHDNLKSSPDAFAREWPEVMKKYPNVAVAYLKDQEALSEGVVFARAANEKAFQASAFHDLVVSLCQREGASKLKLCKPPEPGRPRPACPNCRSVCSTDQSPVDCADCLQKRADAGCL